MLTLRLKRWIAALTVVALLAGTTAFVSHVDQDQGAAHKVGHCELCAHFSGAGNATASLLVAGKPVLAVRQRVAPAEVIRPFRRNVDSRLPRGPPLSA